MPKIKIETNYYTYNQNNIGGRFLLNDRDGIGQIIVVEARNYENDIMFNKIENNCEFILERMRTPNLWLLRQVIDSHRFKFDPIPLMIPNHRQGVESLRVLGIIA